jgi:hypothetical protein
MSGLLDFPIEKQIEFAARRKMSHADWVEHQHALTAEFAAYEESIKDAPESKRWKDPEFQKRVDSENIITFG